MKKVGLKALFFTLICTLIFAGNAFANNATDHVSIAPNGKGDVLIFPAYWTTGGWETKLVVTNTSLTDSVVAKVIIRSKENSQELRDFFIYLSPADVWTGTMYTSVLNGQPWPFIRSTDDSCIGNDGTNFASATNAFDYHLEDVCTGDTNEFGYITVIQGASFKLGTGPGVLKTTIKNEFDNNYGNALSPINSLAGQMEINNATGSGHSYALNATTLKNYDYLTAAKMSLANETKLGENANNTVGEVAAVLAKNEIVFPYYAQTLGSALATVTFPTKLSSLANCAVKSVWTNQFSGFPTPQYSMTAYDLQENSVTTSNFVSPFGVTVNTFPSELNFLSVVAGNAPYDEGWIHIAGSYTTVTTNKVAAFSYKGMPAIAASMRFDTNGNGGMLYNAHTLGDIDLDGNFGNVTVEEYNYHYWGQTDN